MIRRLLVVLALLVSLVSPSLAAKGGSKDSSHKGSSKSGTKTGTKSVHVKGYTKKDGTQVAPHDRKAPESKAAAPKPSTPAAPSAKSSTAPRDANGRIARSEAAKHQFEAQTGYPHGRPGYVVDHKIPLACGGLDAPSNMQWQTVAEPKAKDAVERRGCRGLKGLVLPD